MSDLAIVIPAYKADFLEQALKSLASQTCKDFTLYVGDDASPDNIKCIVDKYINCIDLYYCRFNENIGGRDLVAQWERCISLTQSEKWIWLFSDDDEMDSNCVEKFYETIHQFPGYNLYHFDVNVINERGDVILKSRFPDTIGCRKFYISKLRGNLSSYVVEYIFSRQCYDTCKGFKKFDLAWGSDDATWIDFGKGKGIKTIGETYVRWRKSNVNISPINTDINIVKRKLNSNISFIKWARNQFDGGLCQIDLRICEITWFCTNLIKYRDSLKREDVSYYLRLLCGENIILLIVSFFYYNFRIWKD